MTLAMVDYVRDSTPHDNFGGGSGAWIVWANMWLVTSLSFFSEYYCSEALRDRTVTSGSVWHTRRRSVRRRVQRRLPRNGNHIRQYALYTFHAFISVVILAVQRSKLRRLLSECLSVCLYVHPPVLHTRESPLNGLRYWNTLHTIR